MNEQARLLRNHPLFAKLSGRALNLLTEHATIEHFRKGQTVYKAGDPGRALYLVLSGRCEASLELPGGQAHVLGIHASGDTMGERALLSGDRHWDTVKVITDAALLRLDGADVYRVIERDARFTRQIALELRRDFPMRPAEGDPVRSIAATSRVVALASLSRDALGPVVAENLAHALQEQTGGPVLLAHVLAGSDHPALANCHDPQSHLRTVFSLASEVAQHASGIHTMRLYARGDPREPGNAAACISQMSKHYRYVLIHLDPNVPTPTLVAFLYQADMQFLLLRQHADDLYRGNILSRELREQDTERQLTLMPVVCIEDRQRATANETLSDQLGLAVHHVVHTLPRDEPEPHTHYLRQPGDRFSAHIRRLAREIGRRRLGIALSAGGAKGLAHIGVIQVLEENGIDVDAVAGASMGACVGGLWACGLNGKELENVALRLERPFGLLNLIDFALLPRLGFMRGRKVESMLRDVIGDRHFSETVRQLRIVAMDLDTLERCVFDSGEIAPAIVTSMAMPGVVVPVKNDGHTFIDGGVADPLPTDVLIELGIDRIIGVNTIPTPADLRSCLLINKAQPPPRGRFRLPAALDRRLNYFSPGNILDVLVRSMHGAETRVAEVACKQADVVLRAISCDGKWHDFRNPRKYIQLGRQVAEQHLEELKALTKP